MINGDQYVNRKNYNYEFGKEERDVKMSEEIYMTVQKDYFPNAELVVNVQTGEKSLLSLAIYQVMKKQKRI